MLRLPETIGDDILETQVGTLAFYSGTTDPLNALICDGRKINHSDYPLLVELLNNLYQTGNPKASINIPDCRGLFLRGYGGKSGKLGKVQEGQIEAHTHTLQITNHNENGIVNIKNSVGSAGHRGYEFKNVWETDKTGGDETRPRNMAFNIIIYTGSMKKNLQFKFKNIKFYISKLFKLFKKEV